MKLNITPGLLRSIYRPRKNDTHKGHFGHALLVGGSAGSMGAAVLCTKACVRTGSGLTTLCVPKEERAIVQTAVPEAMLCFREDEHISLEKFNSVAIGPALGLNKEAANLFESIIGQAAAPLVIDADAITLLAQNEALRSHLKPNTVLTPHIKEFDRLFGLHENMEHRIQTQQKISNETGWVIVLKNFETHISHGKQVYRNKTGNAGLAKGGSGDVLTGMIASLLAQRYSSIDAAILGVYLHGLAADKALKNQSKESMLASDVVDNIGKAFKTISKTQ